MKTKIPNNIVNIIFILTSIIYSCGGSNNAEHQRRKSHPSHKYTYVSVDSSDLNYLQTDYVPVYSDIYHRDGTRRFILTTTISIRNTSLSDSAYILNATYYDSYGHILSEYVDSTILLTPLESIEFVVDEEEIVGGAGANFIIDWGSSTYNDQIMTQSVNISTSGQQGLSFTTEAKVIGRKTKK